MLASLGARLALALMYSVTGVTVAERAGELANLRANGVRMCQVPRIVGGENLADSGKAEQLEVRLGESGIYRSRTSATAIRLQNLIGGSPAGTRGWLPPMRYVLHAASAVARTA